MTEPTQQEVLAAFTYKEGALYWKPDPAKSPQWNGKHGAQKAGCARFDGRRVIRWGKKLYLASRLIFLYHKGFLPLEVDHKDTDPTNDLIENLRPAARFSNNANTNAAGYIQRGNKFLAKIYYDGKSHYLGTFDTPWEAREAYEHAQRERLETLHEE